MTHYLCSALEGALTEITDHSVFTHPGEIVVELHGYTPEGEFTALTYQFTATA